VYCFAYIPVLMTNGQCTVWKVICYKFQYTCFFPRFRTDRKFVSNQLPLFAFHFSMHSIGQCVQNSTSKNKIWILCHVLIDLKDDKFLRKFVTITPSCKTDIIYLSPTISLSLFHSSLLSSFACPLALSCSF